MAINFLELLGLQQDPSNPFKSKMLNFNPVLNQASIPQGNPLDPTTMAPAMAPPEVDENGIPVAYGEDINVTDSAQVTPTQSGPGPVAPSMGNANYLATALDANSQSDEVSKTRRQGMFGVKGTLRDVIGTIGDAFLIQGGMNPIYSPARQQERLSDAQAGYTSSEPGALNAALERMNSAGFSKESQQLYNDMEAARIRQAQAQDLGATRDALTEERQFKLYREASNNIARLFANPAAKANPAAALAQAERIAAASGVALEKLLGVPKESVTPEFMQMYSANDMGVQQTMQIPFTERRVAATESQAASSAQRANNDTTRTNRPPPPRAARAQTPLEYFQELSDVPPSQRSADERAWMDKYTKSGTTRGSAPRAAPAGVRGGTGAAPGWGAPRVIR